MKRLFDTHFGYILVYAFAAVIGINVIAEDTSWRTFAACFYTFLLGIHLGFGEAVIRLRPRRTTKPSYDKSDVQQD